LKILKISLKRLKYNSYFLSFGLTLHWFLGILGTTFVCTKPYLLTSFFSFNKLVKRFNFALQGILTGFFVDLKLFGVGFRVWKKKSNFIF